jgi:hypothetical protein
VVTGRHSSRVTISNERKAIVIVILLRSLAAVIAALLLALLGVIGVEALSSVLHPFPPGVDPSNMDACREHVARYPSGVLLLCAAGWWLTVFASCGLATRLGTNRHPAHGLVVGMVLLTLAVFNMAMLPYPSWFWINLIAFPLCSFGGTWLGGCRRLREIVP